MPTGPKKQANGNWKVDERPFGKKGKRFRREFDTKREATNYYRYIVSLADGDKEWNPDTKDDRRISDLVIEWYDLHGHTLKSATDRRIMLNAQCIDVGNPLAQQFTGEFFAKFRKERLEKGTTPNTCNHER